MMFLDKFKNSQKIAYHTLLNGFESKRISHAYLLTGQEGAPLREVAMLLAKSLVCKEETLACEKCFDCQRIENFSYPDFIFVDGEKASIKKSDIEHIQEEFTKVAFEENGKKIYVLHLIEKASLNALNALLKFLEEPSDDVVAILTTNNVSKILPTIISRVQLIRLKEYSLKDVMTLLMDDNVNEEDAYLLANLCSDYNLAIKYFNDEDYPKLKEAAYETLTSYLDDDPFYYAMSSVYPLINTKDRALKYLKLISLILKEVLNYKLKGETKLIYHDVLVKRLNDNLVNIEEMIKKVLIYQGYLDTNMNIPLLIESMLYSLKKEEK